MFNSIIVTQIRSQINRWLTETATVQKLDSVRGEYGELIQDYVTVQTSVPCRIITAGSNNTDTMEVNGNQEMMLDQYKIILPYDAELDVDYRVTVGADIYRVVSILDDRTDGVDVQALIVGER